MSLATLFTPFYADDGLDEFAFSNQDSHTKIIEQLYLAFGIIIPTYLIYPIPLDSVAAWSQSHQQAHNDMNRYLGIGGQDYTGIDFNNKEATAAWAIQHAIEHREAETLLRIT